ncbi:MAG: hypothetical protein DRP78_05500, partial [Candidatus Omnitrophota bacterium]
MQDKHRFSLAEEKPILEISQLIWLGIICLSLFTGLITLFFPAKFVLVLFVGLLLITAISFNPVIGLAGLFFCIYMQPFEFIPALRPFHLTRILSIIVLFIWLAKTLVFRVGIVKSHHNLLAGLFFCICSLSLFQNFDYFFLWLVELLKVIILFFMVANMINTKRSFVGFIWFLIILSVLLAGTGIFEYYSGRQILSYATATVAEHKGDFYRVSGTRGEHSEFAIYLSISIPLILALFFYVKSKFLKLFLVLNFSLIVLAIVFSFSRAGMVTLGFVVFLSILKQRRTFFLLVGLSVVILLIAFFLVPSEYWLHAGSIINIHDPAIQARINMYKGALKAFIAHPVFGIGYRSFYYHSFKYAPVEALETGFFFPHNIFIQTAAELGLAGLSVLISIIVYVFKDLNQACRNFK